MYDTTSTTQTKMNIFGWRKSVSISEQDPTFKVRYLGNVQTAVMKGEGCVDRATSIIWNNYLRSEHPGIEMKIVITGSGMKAYTKEQGLTEYRAHRISYCIAHPDYPKLFVWVYRHEGKKMKLELRCHAVLCKNEAKAKTMALQLHQKLSFALKEFQREKLRKQTSRLVMQRTKSMPKTGNVLPLRTQMLSTANNFRPPVSKSNTAPKLGAITEDEEDECVEEEEEDDDVVAMMRNHVLDGVEDNNNADNCSLPSTPASVGPSPPRLHHKGADHHGILAALDLESAEGMGSDFFNSEPIIDLELGNDLEELRRDDGVQYCIHEGADSDEESAESGFHDQDQDLAEVDKDKEAVISKGKTKLSSLTNGCNDEVCPLPSFGDFSSLTNEHTENTSL
ncbi:protein FAM43A [Biomphalaria glabrata]|uniref:Protein FAM43A-like n=1 Tax=Biomphalaria glabrata TaxID=6526 RepID=A0A9U8EGH9_BIOGL|nr:protein FAM43A-like [Biomphalaria glabrata]KAI8770499.1 protein FAM43A [Biomphalaria glabrata]